LDYFVDHLMIGSDFLCHLIVVGLNVLVDAELLADHLRTGAKSEPVIK
jgi:hypothetical protein